mmetsp:Transcript_25094/g.51269  ORF Transcript_25094/g.51269 Transcript_25094/m.51269 type:complete len:205 (-) Transcript_25094:583-1197(-)
MFVIANQGTLGIGRQGGLTRTGEAEEESRFTALLAHVGRAMHGELIFHRQPVIHEGEDTLLILSAVPSTKDDGLLLFDVENDGNIRVEVVALPVLVDLRAGVDDGEVRLKVFQLLFGRRADEHVGNKVLRPCHFMDEADLVLRLGRRTDEAVEDVGGLSGVEVRDGLVVQLLEYLGSGGLIDVVPVNVGGRFGSLVEDHPLILG